MSNCTECDENIKKAHEAGQTWNLCSGDQCNNQPDIMHQYCNCTGQFAVYPYVQNGICMAGPGTLIPNMQDQCFCCCSCYYMSGTPIAVSKDAVKPAQDFNTNDMVWVAEDASLKTWTQKPVLFSSGTGADSSNSFIKVSFGERNLNICVAPKSFVSESVTEEQADAYYTILSNPPNNFIGKGGVVNQTMVSNAGSFVIAQLLAVEPMVAASIYNILDPAPNYLLVTSSQPFLMKDGTLKQADKLVPGKDVLVCEDGSTTPLISLETGIFQQSIHHIATSLEKATSLDGHLLLANGIVIGDYATQMAMSAPNDPIGDKYSNDPAFGTKVYGDTNPQLLITPSGAYTKS